MISTTGNIWDLHKTHYIVIPTNIGWKQNGANPMGVGLALQAMKRFPGIETMYGKICQEKKAEAPVVIMEKEMLILFPVKPLDITAPNMSWKNDASLALIERSAIQLSLFPKLFAILLVGCGAGNLSEKDVLPILDKHLNKVNGILVREK